MSGRRWHGSSLAMVSLCAGLWACMSLGMAMAAEESKSERPESVLRAVLAKALASKARQVRIPPGVYRVAYDPSARSHLLFDGVQDLAIDARGVELVMADARRSLVAFRNCRRVALRGLTIDCDPLLFTQGSVAAMDPKGGWYDVRIEPGYRADLENLPKHRPMSIFDARTREFKTRVADLYMGRIERTAPDMWRAYPVKEVIGRHRFPTDTVQVGDLAAIPFFGGPGVTCRGCEDMVFEDVTIYHTGGMAFHEHAGPGGTILRRCRVLCRPGTTRLLSTCADGFHCKNMRRGPTVEDCVFEGMHDDGINIHGMFSRVLEPADDGRVLTAPAFIEWAGPGDRVEFFNGPSGRSTGLFRVVASQRLTGAEWTERARQYWPSFGYRMVYRLRLDRRPDVAAGDAMVSASYVGSRFVVRNNRFRNHRYRAILIKASHGLVEGNHITGCTNDAISLTPILYNEAGFVRDVVVRGNVIRRVGMLPWHRAAIKVSVAGAASTVACREHRGLTIEDNVIEDAAGGGILVTNANGVEIKGNRLSAIGHRRVSARTPLAIEIRNSDRVSVVGNVISKTAPACARIAVDPSCSAGTVEIGANRVVPLDPSRR